MIVDYDPLPVAVDMESAMEVAAPVARPHRHIGSQDGEMASPHAAVGHGDDNVAVGEVEIGGIAGRRSLGLSPRRGRRRRGPARLTEELSPNVIGRHWHRHGDVEAALAGSAATVSGRFETDWVYQGYLEPHAATAWTDPVGGNLVVSSGTQGIFYARSQLAKIFGLPVTKVRSGRRRSAGRSAPRSWSSIRSSPAPSLALKRPVRLALDRREDIVDDQPGVGDARSSSRSAPTATAG